jgi:hypothetical protein
VFFHVSSNIQNPVQDSSLVHCGPVGHLLLDLINVNSLQLGPTTDISMNKLFDYHDQSNDFRYTNSSRP